MSEFSRETLLNIIETDHVQCGEASALARMALAAMDSSESVELPLDYLQGHKDGLEWAARLAEANHPETGDWLYDDPIELAKAIRKGPDMPPAQSVADSEPDRNPVLAYADSYRDMAKQGVESVPIWSVITDLERNIAPLYRHAQPAPEREQLAIENFHSAIEGIGHIRRTLEETFGRLHGTHVEPDVLAECKAICGAIYAAYGHAEQPVVPDDGLIAELLAIAKEAADDADAMAYAEFSDNSKRHTTAIADWERRAAMLAASPQSPGSEPATVPGKWIPVSERMPEVGVKVLCFPAEDEPIHAVFNGQLWLQDVSWSGSEEPIDNVIPVTVTHWMPLPAVPHEGKP